MSQEVARLRVQLEGDAPGLKAHRLSVGAFGEPLTKLLLAYRRIASGIASDALSDPGYGQHGGKYTKQAKGLDLEIYEIVESSLGLGVAATIPDLPAGDAYSLFPGDFAQRAAVVLLDSIEAESRGELRNASVRAYLKSLPAGITRQRYSVHQNGRELRKVEISSVDLPELPESVPYLERVVQGTVAGVGFEPGPIEVRIKTAAGILTFAATAEHITQALELRGKIVDAMALYGITTRLLWIRTHVEGEHEAPHEERVRTIAARWDGVLRRLA